MPQEWTEERKQAARENLARARAKKKAMEEAEKQGSELPQPEVTNKTEQSTEELLRNALEAINNLAAQNAALQAGAAPSGTVAANGKIVGTTTKYGLDPALYPDPTPTLYDTPELARFGFKSNYDLAWKIDSVRYQTADGVWMQEPRFNVDLIRKLYNEETGEDTGGRYIECRLVFHEDPEAALIIAREKNLTIDQTDEKAFLDEMRRLLVRDWLVERFLPKKPKDNRSKKDMVINNKLVQFYEISSEEATSIPFNELTTKL